MIPTHARPLLFLALILAVTTAAFLPGLNGDLILDDRHNLAPVLSYAQGDSPWQEAIMSASGRFGRPVSMATFVFNAWTTDSYADLIWSFKLTNLIIHLVAGILIYLLTSLLIQRDQNLAPNARWIALIVTAAWLLAPLQVSTVLYTIQRMAQLSALFIVLGLLSYVHGRNKIIAGRIRSGMFLLFGAFPLTLALGVMCKENALLLPVLAGVIEIAYFLKRHRPNAPIKAFHTLFLLAPGLLAVGYLIVHPETITAGYTIRDFTLAERLLSQPRVLFGYLSSLFVPNAHGLGLFHDDYQISTSLIAPVTTLLSILGWIAILALAWLAWRRNRPTVCFGVLFYLGAQCLESGIFALEIYFEHRNYLPCLGAIAAVVAGLAWALERSVKLSRLAPAFVLIYLAVFSAATWARTSVWASTDAIVEQAAKGHPDSPRVRVHLATRDAREHKIDSAISHLEVARLRDPLNMPTYALNEVFMYCVAGLPVPPSAYEAVAKAKPTRLSAATTGTYRTLIESIEARFCPQMDLTLLKTAVDAWIVSIDQTADPDSLTMQRSWLLRMFHGRMISMLGHYAEAARHTQRAFELVPDRVDVGLNLIQLQLSAGAPAGAMATIEQIEGSYNGGNPQYDTALAELKLAAKKLMDNGQ